MQINPMMVWRWTIALCWMGLALAVRAQDSLPQAVPERLWLEPGPEQSSPAAPRLLIIYPAASQGPLGTPVTRYAGRVEPPDARVTLNGQALKVWPGGVFTGTREVTPPQGKFEVVWRFEATGKEAATVVERSLQLERPAQPPARWPLEFYEWPVYPTGDYLLAPGEALEVSLFGSPGHRAQVRVGQGKWRTMNFERPDEHRGGVYKIRLKPPAPGPQGLHEVTFRLEGSQGDADKSIYHYAQLRVARCPAGVFYRATVTPYLATALKGSSGWERWGNWAQGTLFSFNTIKKDRLQADLGPLRQAWAELDDVSVDWTPRPAPRRPLVPLPQVNARKGDSLRLDWPQLQHPAPVIFEYLIPQDSPQRLNVWFPGAVGMNRKEYDLHRTRPFSALQAYGGSLRQPEHLELELERPLWGYALEASPDLQLDVRVKPRLRGSDPRHPLEGMHIMVDAGHGGSDRGAVGPSGLCEADVNWVQAMWLGEYLSKMGAQVEQTRPSQEGVTLDERCQMARRSDPDLFISLHHNSVGMPSDPMADAGPKVYYHYRHSRPLAQAIAAGLTPLWPQLEEPRVFDENFRVNRNISLCPSVLVETGFVCNPEDEVLLRDIDSVKKTAQAIAQAVKEYLLEDQTN